MRELDIYTSALLSFYSVLNLRRIRDKNDIYSLIRFYRQMVIRKQRNTNYDEFVLNKRAENYKQHRRSTFERMYKKHLQDECLDLHIDPNNIDALYEDGTLNKLYAISQSITQSLRASVGHEFEAVIEEILRRENIIYQRQVPINKHRVDFVVNCTPPIILSAKTTLRERYLQDAHLKNVVYITLDKSPLENVCTIDAEKLNLTRLIADLKNKQ